MPVHRGNDHYGPYYQWGSSGKRYYYIINDKKSRDKAKQQAQTQGNAIFASGYRSN